MKKNKFFQPWQQILLSMVLGIITGLTFGKSVSILNYLGIVFLNMIKMITMPLIFCTIIYGMTGVENYSGLGRLSKKAILIFLTTAVIAACIGLTVSSIIQPGNTNARNTIISMINDSQQNHTETVHQSASLVEFFVNIISNNIFQSFVSGNILQIIVFAFFCGIILNKSRAQCEDLIKIIHQITQMFFHMISYIMKFAPLGVFGYTTCLVAFEGIETILVMIKLIITILIGCIIQYILFGIILLIFGKISPIPFYKKISYIQLLAFSTSSSKAALVPMMNTCENKLGISKEGSRFILPLSAALNMDGGAIYQASCVVFFSQIYNTTFQLHEYIIIIIMSTIASIGGAGIPSGVLLFLGMVLNAVGLPMNGVLIIATIDRILDMMTTAINVTGDMFATLMVEISEKRFNKKTYYSNTNNDK